MESKINVDLLVSVDTMTEEDMIEASIDKLRARLNEVREDKVAKDAAKGLYRIYSALLEEGFSDKQAFKIIMKQMDGMR